MFSAGMLARLGTLFVAFQLTATVSAAAQTPTTIGVDQIPVTVSRPDGPGPFPAVVIMHDCSGLGPASSGAA